MSANRRKFDEDFKAGAVQIVQQTGKSIAQVARELGIHEAR
jgi:transposase